MDENKDAISVATQEVIAYSVIFPAQLGENTQSEIWFLHLKKETTKHIVVPSFKGVDKIPINHKRTFAGSLYYKNLVILYLVILYCTVL